MIKNLLFQKKAGTKCSRQGFRNRLKGLVLVMLLCTSAAFGHVTEIRVNQGQDGKLTWYLSSYHGKGECGVQGSGLTINGVNYPLEAEFTGDVANFSSNVFATLQGYAHTSYAIVHTPFLGTNLSVQPYSTNACWSFLVGGNGNFTPPPPPVCTSSPLTGWSNTFASSGNNNNTFCDPTDDRTTATIKVSHLACANITGDKQFRVIFDPTGTNVSYGPFNYAAGVETSVGISVPYGASNSTLVKVIDDDFPAEITHGLVIPNGQYLGEKETVPPVITSIQGNVIVPLNSLGAATLPSYTSSTTATDNCSSVSITQAPEAGMALAQNRPVTVILTAKDASGNFTTQTFTVTAKDQTTPIATAKNITKQLDASGNVTVTAAEINDGSSDNVGIASMTVSPSTFNCSNINLSSTASLTYNMAADDYIDASISKDDISAGNQFAYGDQWFATYSGTTALVPGSTYYLHIKATNGGGQGMFIGDFKLSGDFEFEDGSKTLVTGPSTFKVSSTGFGSNYQAPFLHWANGGPIWGYKAAISPSAQFIYGPTNTWYFSTKIRYTGFSNTVTLTVADASGNVSTATANVTIEDKIAPVKPVLENVTGECSVTATPPTTTDNCKGVVTGTTADPLTYTTQGTHVITWNFNDGNGNTTIATQNVIVKDVTAPVAPTLAGIRGECSVTAPVPTATDNCSGNITGTTTDAVTYTTQGTHVITWTFNDGNGNTTTATQDVIVKDVTAPVAPVLADVTAECSATAVAPTAQDNCSGAITGTTSDATSFTAQGTYTINWTFTDAAGNSSFAIQNVVIKDVTAPVILAPANVVAGSCNSISLGAPLTSDNCEVVSVTNNAPATFPVGTTTVVWTVTDAGGNTASATQTIKVAPAPVAAIAVSRVDGTFTGLPTSTIALGYGAQNLTLSATGGDTYKWSNNLTSASATTASITVAPTTTTTYTVIATDIYGCSTPKSITVTVVDVRCGNKMDKVVVCHKTGSAKNPTEELCIAPSAVATHLAHGDKIGSCGSGFVYADVVSTDKLELSSIQQSNSLEATVANLSAYPNPFGSKTTVSFTLVEDEAKVSLDLFGLNGVRVQHVYSGAATAFKTQSFEFNSSNLPSGTYFFRLTGSKANLTFKVIIAN
ncbi:MAG: hypothetical protein K0S09_1260 [Sphingobacteriaceae bacterium]|jgi:hypothetical protein|nr:hypothetical protein [Sphingobacteriaceae bacterium]